MVVVVEQEQAWEQSDDVTMLSRKKILFLDQEATVIYNKKNSDRLKKKGTSFYQV